MTGITIRRCTLVNTVDMTRTALNRSMLAQKRESSIVVVEGHIAPPAGVMTGTTVRAELSVMLILRCVAGITIRRCTLENTVGMTGTALNRSMLTRKQESSIVVVEIDIRPFGGFMTRSTVRTELSVMFILRCMAGVTIFRRPFINIIHMT